jgi:hypothetical protein
VTATGRTDERTEAGPGGGDTARGRGDARGDDARDRSSRATAAVVGGLTAVVTLPLVIALASLHSPRWYPLLDLAMTELRVRDVGTRHTPLVGLVGRLSSDGNQGSHPGPISFWALAPVYRLLGGSAWSLLVGVVVLNTTAVALTLWIAVRQGGRALALAVAAGLAVLFHLYGTQVLTEPWNPYMPVMWWPLTLMALWAVLCDDLAMMPVAVFAASFCMQTHISYLGLVGGFGAVVVVWVTLRGYRLRADRPALRRLLRWSAIALGLAVVLWLPPLIDQVTGTPGNAGIVLDHFRHPDEDPIGIGRGGELFAVHLNPWRLVAGQQGISGSVVPGLALVATWVAAAVVAWRLPGDDDSPQRRLLVRLHAVIAVALVLGFVSSTRILGFVWHYLVLWAWSVNMLIVLAVAWTALAAVAARATEPPRPRAARAGLALLGLVLVAWTAMFAVDAADAEPTQANYSAMVGEFTTAVTEAIDAGAVEGGGPDGRYVITWTDGVNLGSTGFGLLDEMERLGYDVGVIRVHGPGARPHRVMPGDEATAEIHISLGPDIPVWDAKPEAERVALVDLRSDEDVAAYDRARAEAIALLERDGHDAMVPLVDRAPFQLYFDEELADDTRAAIKVINDIGQPAAVYVGPVTLAR